MPDAQWVDDRAVRVAFVIVTLMAMVVAFVVCMVVAFGGLKGGFGVGIRCVFDDFSGTQDFAFQISCELHVCFTARMRRAGCEAYLLHVKRVG